MSVCAVIAALAISTQENKPWIAEHQDGCMLGVFLLGYTGIILEEMLALNKSGVALIMASSLWSVRACGSIGVESEVAGALAEVSEVVFFLLGAMTVVEVVDAHEGFALISRQIRTRNKVALLWLTAGISFLLSAMLDNLTTTIVMVSLLTRACPDAVTRRFLGAVVVVAANAGGAWSPIGDVTTTMLWVDGQLNAVPTITSLFVPSAVSLVVPLAAMSVFSPEFAGDANILPSAAGGGRTPPSSTVGTGDGSAHAEATTTAVPSSSSAEQPDLQPRGRLVLSAGIGSLMLVPVFRSITGLPPYMAMLTSLGFLWVFTDALHFGEDRSHLRVSTALKRIDSEGVLFFLGILLAVAALNTAGLLKEIALFLDANVPSERVVASIIGLASALVDNVPLVAATQGMYDLSVHPPDSSLWQLIAYCAGTGGSLLIIGSSAGVAYMGLSEGATFGWYARTIAPWALLGYISGLAAYVATHLM